MNIKKIHILFFIMLGQTVTSYPQETANTSIFYKFSTSKNFGERTLNLRFESEVTVHINAPSEKMFKPEQKTLLIFYALPNGNNIEQTIGKKLNSTDDWHFDIQHIGAQTRFLREHYKEANLIIVYLMTDGKSWPTWRKNVENSNLIIQSIVDSVVNLFYPLDIKIALSGHSGGGSFIFGYLNGVKKIPDIVERITFLDSNYGYEDSLKHGDKIIDWLKESNDHFLSVIAYDDRNVKINGKNIVSPTGGTYYRSEMMKERLQKDFGFISECDSSFTRYFSLNGRIQFILKENPNEEIFHTVLVERNGFIQSILSGTEYEAKKYEFWGKRCYEKWITE